jgi:hypothetical protein
MSSDTQFAEQEQVIDPSLQEMMDAAEQIEESEEQIGRPDLPKSDYHVGHIAVGEFREVYSDKIPAVRVGLTVTEGVKGAVDRTYYDDLFLGWGEKTATGEKDAQGKAILRDATETEIAERRAKTIGTLKKFARVFGLRTILPTSLDKQGVEAWLLEVLEMKGNGPTVVFTGYSKNGYTRIIFNSLRNASDPGKDPKTREVLMNKTALEVAREQIAKAGGQTAGATADSGF